MQLSNQADGFTTHAPSTCKHAKLSMKIKFPWEDRSGTLQKEVCNMLPAHANMRSCQ